MANRLYTSQISEDSSFLNYTSCSSNSELVPCAAQSSEITTSLRCFSNQSSYGANASNLGSSFSKLPSLQSYAPTSITPLLTQHQIFPYTTCYNRNRYMPYSNRPCTSYSGVQYPQQLAPVYTAICPPVSYPTYDRPEKMSNLPNVGSLTASGTSTSGEPAGQPVTLQINNLDYSMDEISLRHFLLSQLKPITPVLSLVFEGNSYVKLTVPDLFFAKQVVSNLHRKKIGHKRMVVSYSRDSSLTEINTLRCQVAGLLKDVPYCTLPMYKFRELFQSRFKTSISVLDLYKMLDICNITTDKNEEKYITLHPDLIRSIENSPLMECLQHSVPYCTVHFKREQHKGWAEQDIEPLPNVFMTISDIQAIIYPLLRNHTGDIPVASLVHCIQEELGTQIARNDNGVHLEHLICCVQGIQITTNNFGIKILGWLEPENAVGKESNDSRFYTKSGNVSDPLYQISREVVELVKMSPKSTMKFNRFIPAYHNHFGKQCRVADYGYTRLIELFEALSSVIQIMGDGENRQITLTHRTQIRRFTSDLLRILRTQGNKSVLLSQLPKIFSQTQNRAFDVTDYGICNVVDILDGLVNSNTVVVTSVQTGNDILISIPKRKQTTGELEKTCVFAGEVVDLFRNAPQYSVLFQKFVRSYHYHFGYQCRLSDYGFLKLADLMESIQGIVEIEFTTDEDKRIFLSPIVAQRVFAEQLEDLIRESTGSSKTCKKLDEVLQMHKKKYGYQIMPETLGVQNIMDAIKLLPYIELLEIDNIYWIICHFDDPVFRSRSFRACKIIQDFSKDSITLQDFISAFQSKYSENLVEQNVVAMKHAITIETNSNGIQYLYISDLMKFIIRIIRALEQRYMTLNEIKLNLNIGIGACFPFGYANLYTLLRAYPDIFVVEIGSSQEKSEIGLVIQGDLISHLAYNYTRTKNKSIIKQEKTTLGAQRQALAPYNKQIKPETVCDESNLNDSATQAYFKQNSSINNKIILKHPLYNNNKENIYNHNFNGSLNSSSISDANSSTGSSVNISGESKLLSRRNTCYLDSGCGAIESLSNMPLYPYYGPPKPDTPPPDISRFQKKPSTDNKNKQVAPFWTDPIWANGNGELSPKIESLNIHLPELKSFDFLPMIMSPYSLSKSENMKQMFSFDNTDGPLLTNQQT